MAPVESTICLTVEAASSANIAWDLLHTTYANKSHIRIFILRDQLKNMKKASKMFATYVQEIRLIVDVLKVVGSLVANDELVI